MHVKNWVFYAYRASQACIFYNVSFCFETPPQKILLKNINKGQWKIVIVVLGRKN